MLGPSFPRAQVSIDYPFFAQHTARKRPQLLAKRGPISFPCDVRRRKTTAARASFQRGRRAHQGKRPRPTPHATSLSAATGTSEGGRARRTAFGSVRNCVIAQSRRFFSGG